MKFDPVSFAMGVSSAPVDPELADATATRADILYPKTAYLANGHKNTGTIQSIEAATYTPSTIDQTIQSGKYLAGDQTILGDSNLTPENIKKSISIFGVTGTYSGITNESKSVRFIDYDGSIVHSFTPEEFAQLSSLPSNPIHEGLVAKGWNWTLSNAKTYVASYGSLNIGQMYTTASGATEIDITLKAPNLSPYLIISTGGEITIDWGDNSELQTVSGAGQKAIQHIYAQAGNYTISIFGNNTITFTGNVSTVDAGVFSPAATPTKSNLYSSTITAIRLNENAVIGSAAFAFCTQMQYITIPDTGAIINSIAFTQCYSLKAIVLPSGIASIQAGAFKDCCSLEKICIPRGVTFIGDESFFNCTSLVNISLPNTITTIYSSVFSNCDSLKEIIIPNSVTSMSSNTFKTCYQLSSANIAANITSLPASIFQYCHDIKDITLSNSITTISDSAFANCFSLQNITIPSNVNKIYANVFANCYSLSAIHFLPTAPPTVTNSNAFSYIPTNCIIYIPEGSLSAYISATNYPSSSTYTYVEE